MKKILSFVLQILVTLMYLLSAQVFVAGLWIHKNLNVTFSQLLATLTGNLDGNIFFPSIRLETIKQSVAVLLLLISLLVIFLVLEKKASKGNAKKQRIIFTVVMAILSVSLLLITGFILDAWTQLKNSRRVTTLYEGYYIVPEYGLVTENGDTNNLILIYLESMESSLADDKNGGICGENNYIPELTKLAEKNISFSDGGTVGGLYCTNGANTTKSALITTTTGGAEYQNSLTLATYYPSAPSLGEILKDKAYYNYFLCGSDSKFEDMDQYLKDKGQYEIFDYYSAISEGYIDENHKVWWGYEDEILYKIAKDKLSKIAAKGEKFSFIMQTMDTHFPDGYVCGLCNQKYETQYLNVYACADRQIGAFIEWCTDQPWFANTTIVIIGDHPTMDSAPFLKIKASERTVYNCFINAKTTPEQSEKTRTATTQDIFPTVLSAMGFTVSGSKLGLGTDLFSNEKTLAEQLGYSVLSNNMEMSSQYCCENFVREDMIPASEYQAPEWLHDYLVEHMK